METNKFEIDEKLELNGFLSKVLKQLQEKKSEDQNTMSHVTLNNSSEKDNLVVVLEDQYLQLLGLCKLLNHIVGRATDEELDRLMEGSPYEKTPTIN